MNLIDFGMFVYMYIVGVNQLIIVGKSGFESICIESKEISDGLFFNSQGCLGILGMNKEGKIQKKQG